MIQYSLAEAIAVRPGAQPAGSMFPRILAASVTAAVQVVFERWITSDPPVALGPMMRRGLNELAEGMRRTLDSRESDTG
jgi:MftR C-terminal domain